MAAEILSGRDVAAVVKAEITDRVAALASVQEVRFVRAARAAGRFKALDVELGVSARRWERDGWLRRTLQNRLLAAGHLLGISSTRLARSYGRNRNQQAGTQSSDTDAKPC